MALVGLVAGLSDFLLGALLDEVLAFLLVGLLGFDGFFDIFPPVKTASAIVIHLES